MYRLVAEKDAVDIRSIFETQAHPQRPSDELAMLETSSLKVWSRPYSDVPGTTLEFCRRGCTSGNAFCGWLAGTGRMGVLSISRSDGHATGGSHGQLRIRIFNQIFCGSLGRRITLTIPRKDRLWSIGGALSSASAKEPRLAAACRQLSLARWPPLIASSPKHIDLAPGIRCERAFPSVSS